MFNKTNTKSSIRPSKTLRMQV